MYTHSFGNSRKPNPLLERKFSEALEGVGGDMSRLVSHESYAIRACVVSRTKDPAILLAMSKDPDKDIAATAKSKIHPLK